MPIRVYVFLVVAMISVSSTSLVIRHVSLVPALTLAFWRMLSASGMLWLYSAKQPTNTILAENRSKIVFAGIFLGLHFALFFIGVRNTSVASATLLANTGPIFTATMAWYGNQRLSKWVYVGLIFSSVGILSVQGSGLDDGINNLWANLLSLLSGLCIAITYVFASKIRKETDTVTYGKHVFFIAATTIGVIALFSGDSLFDFNKSAVPWFLFLGLVPSILGHNLLNYSIKYLSPTAVASVPLGEPVLASMFGFLLFSEVVPIGALYGGPCILFGIYLIIKNSTMD